jgi:cytochrome c-type biogenesis protein CcmH
MMEAKKHRPGLLVLAVAAIVLILSLSYAALRSGGGDAGRPAAPAAADQPTGLAAIEEHTRAAPEDADGWLALGQAQFDLGRYAQAAAAYERGTVAAPGRAGLWSALGEARVMASAHDPMPAPALAAFRKASAIDPRDPRSRYFLAVARDLGGDHQGAIGDWLALLRDTPPGAPWERDLRRTIEQVGKINGIQVASRLAAIRQPAAHPPVPDAGTATTAIPGPSVAQMRAAAALPPHQQDAMVQSMVAGLEAKLRTDPANVDGWVMLMRSRMTLGEAAKASAALNAAVDANPGAKARLQAEASALGVPNR